MIDEFPLSVLVLSPTPPVPRDYGNRNRVFQTIDFFRSHGYRISFLLYPFDDDWHQGVPSSYRDLIESFEYFATIPNSRKLHQNSVGHYHQIDEWWDETIGMHLDWLMSRKRFDVMLVNYTFFSKAFEYMRNGTVGILDTHDIFSGRREIFEAAGVAPEFFYTTQDQEKLAFDRAQGIIAIKRSEADWIRTVTKSSVFNIPYWDTRPGTVRARSGGVAFDHERPLRIGFIGAENSVNIVNMQRFLHTISRYIEYYNAPIQVVVAGNVCKGLSDYPFLTKLGRVRLVSDFYEQIDATIAPLEFSTGIKIKVGEALAQHIPVIATHNAFDGFRAYHHTHSEAELTTLCDALVSLAYGEISLSTLEAASEKAAVSGYRAHRQGFKNLQGWIKTHLRRAIVLTDRCFWYRANLFDEVCSQAIEYLGQVLPTVVCGAWSNLPDAKRINASLEFRDVEPTTASIERLLHDASSRFVISMLLIVSSDRNFIDLASIAARREDLSAMQLKFATCGLMDVMRFESLRDGGTTLIMSPLRYTPIAEGSTVFNEDELDLYVSDQPTEWGEVAARSAEIVAAECGIRARRITVPLYAEFSDDFFRQNLRGTALRAVCIMNDQTSMIGLQQLARVRGQSFMLLHEDLIFPETSCSGHNTPSLLASLVAFLSRPMRSLPSIRDADWSNVWKYLNCSGR